MWPLDAFLSAPPIARYASSTSFLHLQLTDHRTLAAVAFTFSVLLYTGVIPISPFTISLPHLIQLPPELWRLFTALLITGPNLGLLFDTYFRKASVDG